jgi:hypothetical protein
MQFRKISSYWNLVMRLNGVQIDLDWFHPKYLLLHRICIWWRINCSVDSKHHFVVAILQIILESGFGAHPIERLIQKS